MATKKKTNKTTGESAPEAKEQKIEAAEEEKIESVRDTRPTRSKYRIGINTANKRSLSPGELRDMQIRRDVQLEMIRGAIHNKTILKNSVVSVATKANGVDVVCLTIALPEGIKAIIPYSKVFQNDPMDKEKFDADTPMPKRQEQILRGMIGSEIRWVPEEIVSDPKRDTIVVVGSRTAALAIDRRTYYLRDNPNIKNGGTYRGRIVSVKKNSALVLLGGVEKVIPQNTLSNRYAQTVSELYKPGDPIAISVKELSVNKKTEEISVMFDCLTGELIESQENMKRVTVNETIFGRISKTIPFTDVDGVKRTRIYAWLDWDVPAKVTGVPYNRFGIPLKPGDRIMAKVTGFDEEGYVTCYILNVLNTTLL